MELGHSGAGDHLGLVTGDRDTSPEPAVEALYGLRVQSDLPLAGRLVHESPDLLICVGESWLCPPPDSEVGTEIGRLHMGGRTLTSVLALDGGGWSIRFHGLAEAVVGAGAREVVLHEDPRAPAGMLNVLTAGPVLALVLALNGVACLHASAVAYAGTATAFVGGSGAGKSSLAGLCCGLGADLVADDILRLDVTDAHPMCYPGGRELRLRPGAATIAAALSDRAQRATGDGRTAVQAGPASLDPLPLAGVIVPVLGADETSVTSLRGTDATKALLAATRVGILRLDSATTAALDLAVRVTATVPVWEVHLSRETTFPRRLPEELVELIGLGG